MLGRICWFLRANVYRTILLLLLGAALGTGIAMKAHWIIVTTGERAWKGEVAFAYLSTPVGKDAKGKPITRAMVLDYLIAKELGAKPNAQ